MVLSRQPAVAVDSAVLPAESAAVVRAQLIESPSHVSVEVVAEVEAAGGVGGGSRVDVEGDVEGVALGLVVGFFGAGPEVGGVVPLGVIFEARVRLLPDRSGHTTC